MIPQFLYIIVGLLVLPFLPILYLQGKRVKLGMVDLPPATENLSGQIGNNEGQKYKMLVMGESSIAGVGIKNHHEGITGNIAKYLHLHTGSTIQWQVIAKSGYTVEMIRKRLVIQAPIEGIDVIILGLGANDAFHLHSPTKWEDSLFRLLQRIRAKYPTTPIVIANLPPVGQFPAFPFLMRMTMAILIKLFSMKARQLPARFPNVHFINREIRLKNWLAEAKTSNVKDLFIDGVHPSAISYELWGKEVANFILQKEILKS